MGRLMHYSEKEQGSLVDSHLIFFHQIKRVTAAELSLLAFEALQSGWHTTDFLVLSLPV